MSNVRFFSGARDARKSVASEMMRLEILKKGKLTAQERYKRILHKKQTDYKNEAMLSIKTSSDGSKRVLSKRAELAMKQIAMKKAAKQAKAERRMVIVQPRTFQNGRLTRKGQIYDVAGNMVGQVNTKNGKMSLANTGASIGRYKPKSYMTELNIQNAINLHSPYFINLRKMQAMQQLSGFDARTGGIGLPSDVINIYGPQSASAVDNGGARQNINVTAWGAMSDNTWGTFTDNAWGTVSDNVWGGTYNDVWGGVGVGGLWGVKGPNIWGTGNGKNYLKKVSSFITALFGFGNKKDRQRYGVRSGGGGAPVRSGGGSAPVRTTRR